jgi:photosystem II stability/assembly factor-like uncharacterized protein
VTILTNVLGLCSAFICFQNPMFCQKTSNHSGLFDINIHSYSTDSCHARGIHVSDHFVYTANSNGSVWEYDLQKKQASVRQMTEVTGELRDIELVGDTLVLMQSGTGLVINLHKENEYRTVNAQKYVWDSVFMDGMDFCGKSGFLMGDPINGKFSLFFTADGGTSWNKCLGDVSCYEGEAGFAASGTNVQVLNDSTFVFVSGGNKSRFFKSSDRGKNWQITSLPFPSNPSTGAYSLLMLNELHGIVIGGDYTKPNERKNTCFLTFDGGKTWQPPKRNPGGYRSCVQSLGDMLFCCGTNGIDFSINHGKTWKPLRTWNSFSMATNGYQLFVTLPNGKFAEIMLKE